METNATLHSGSVKSQPNQADSLHLHFRSPNSVCLVNRDTRTQARLFGRSSIESNSSNQDFSRKFDRKGAKFSLPKKIRLSDHNESLPICWIEIYEVQAVQDFFELDILGNNGRVFSPSSRLFVEFEVQRFQV